MKGTYDIIFICQIIVANSNNEGADLRVIALKTEFVFSFLFVRTSNTTVLILLGPGIARDDYKE